MKIIFTPDIIRKIVTNPRIQWTDKYFTRKMSAIKWLNDEANRKGFTGFETESFYNNAWRHIWCQGMLPDFAKLDPQQKQRLDVYLEICNEVARRNLGINLSGLPLHGKMNQPDYIFRASGLRAWVIETDGQKIRLKLENGSISDWLLPKEVEAVAKHG
jgi:hypothetical protein